MTASTSRLPLLALAAGLLVTGCANVTPKKYVSSDDACRGCPPGLFSGEDGKITLVGQSSADRQKEKEARHRANNQ